jgi:hypothetical protein
MSQFFEGIRRQEANDLAEKRYFYYGLVGFCLAALKYHFGGIKTSPPFLYQKIILDGCDFP